MSLELTEIVGRTVELGQIEKALDALADGGLACLTVEGEAGIGKSRLLRELKARADARDALVLSGSAAEFERDMPFGVWVDAIDAYVASQVEGMSRAWEDVPLDELVGVLPSLRHVGLEPDPALADERYRVHRAARALFEHLSFTRPLALVLDDLHWADAASVELLGSLLRRPPEGPVLMALAFRPGQAPERLASALAVQEVARVRLGQLSQADAAQLLDGIDPRAVAAIIDHGGGNPFYLHELARASEGGRLAGALRESAGDAAPGTGVPPAVAASLAEELESLSPPARALLDGAAVAGEPFDPDLARQVAGMSASEGLAALDDLLDLDLVRATQVPRRFVFRHPLIRRAVYESTRGGWRLAAHARAAEALAAQGAAVAERAHHVEQSAAQGDEEAVELLADAGAATVAHAPATAARWFEAALRLLPAGDRERQAQTRVWLASALRSDGELDRCRATLLEAIDLLPEDAVTRRVELTALCAAVEHWLGRHEDAHRRLTRAWEELPEGCSHAATTLEVELAVDGLYELDLEQTMRIGERALADARELDDGPLIAAAAAALALGEAAAGHVEAAARHRDEAVEQIDRLTDAELAPQLEALYYLGWAESYLERFDRALEHAERGIRIARATGEGRMLVPMMLVKGYPLELTGDLAEALAVAEAAVESARLSGNPHYLFWALFELGFAHYHLGELDAVLVACEESVRVGGRLTGGTMPAGGGGPGWVQATTMFELGEVERGFELLKALGGVELEGAVPVERCFNWESMALAELHRGRAEAAESYVVRAEEHAARLEPLRMPRALARRARAALLLAAGRPREAAEAAADAVDGAAAAGAGLQAAFGRSLQGRALAAAGEREQAIATLREAERELDGYGSLRVRDEVRRELRKLGARSEPRGPATAEETGVEALTKRELEIASLVTDRKTNKEIATELFLSGKTVESHLRNIFIKLGVSSRVEVARALERHRREAGDEPA